MIIAADDHVVAEKQRIHSQARCVTDGNTNKEAFANEASKLRQYQLQTGIRGPDYPGICVTCVTKSDLVAPGRFEGP